MSKAQIKGSEFSDTNLEYQVCSHLKPIQDLLTENGNSFSHPSRLIKERDGASIKLLPKPIDFDLVEQSFEIPSFITLGIENNAILCERCWCEIKTEK